MNNKTTPATAAMVAAPNIDKAKPAVTLATPPDPKS